MKAPENPATWPATDEANSLDEAPPTAKQRYAAPLALMAVSLATFFFGLGRLALLGPDEPRYAEIAREMMTSGDWISPRLCGCLWFEKPALIYWMSGLSYRLFGVSELAARLPVAIAATLTVLLLYFVLKRVASMRAAFFAGLALATCGMFIGYARVASPDMLLAAAMTAALLVGFLATQASGRKRTLLWATSFGAMALAVLAKGLPGIALVVLIFIIYLIWIRRTAAINWREALLGTALFSLIAATWYVPVTMRHGGQFLYEFFFRHHFERFTSNEFGHPQPFYFFFIVAIAGLLPWPAFLLPAIARLRRLQPRNDAGHALLAFAWVWAAVIVIFFSFSGSKLPGYILPAFPALAIIVGFEIESFVAGARRRLPQVAAWITALLVAALAIGFAVYLHLEVVSAGSPRVTAYVLLGAIAPVAAIWLINGKRAASIASAACVILSVVICAAVILAPKLNDEQTRKQLSLEAAAALRPSERIGFFVLLKEYAPVFYAQGRVACGIGEYDVFNAMSRDELAEALQNEPSLVILTLERWRGGLEQDARFNIELLARQRDHLALRVSLR